MARYVVVDNPIFWRQQRPSLVVVVGNGPAFNPATQQLFQRPKQFFVSPNQIAVSQRNWQSGPGGGVNYTIDVSHNTFAKVFVPEDTFPQNYRTAPRLTTDFFSNADIFAGFDTVGWPDSPDPASYPQQMRGAFNTIQAFVAYNPAPDVWLLRKQDKYFPEVPIQWGPTPLFLRSSQDTYQTYLDVPRNAQQAKVFSEYQIQWDFKQPITQNVLFTTFAYNPATDVTRFKTQDKTQIPPETFFNIQQTGSLNTVTFVPPPYNPNTDVRFPRRIQFVDTLPDTFIRIQLPARVVWDVPQVAPPVPPTFLEVIQNWQGRVVLSPKKIGEQVFVPIDFISRLSVGETILTANVTCTVYSGSDPSPQSMIIGAAGVVGTVVEQEVGQGVLGTIYELLFRITTSLGQTLELSGYFAVVPDLP